MSYGPRSIDLPARDMRRAIEDAVRADRERCARIVRDLAVVVGSSSRAFEEAIERIRKGW